MHVELSSNRIALSMGSNIIVFCSFLGGLNSPLHVVCTVNGQVVHEARIV